MDINYKTIKYWYYKQTIVQKLKNSFDSKSTTEEHIHS